VAGWLVASRILRPIGTITRTARRTSSTSLHERLELDGPQDELKELGDPGTGRRGSLTRGLGSEAGLSASESVPSGLP
jgi:HAMP domain